MTQPERQKDIETDLPDGITLPFVPGVSDLPGCVFSDRSPRTLYANTPEGRRIHISEVGERRTGFVCRDCGSPLLPVRGQTRRHHFRHASGDDCPHAGETDLHRNAKKIIAAAGGLSIPGLVVSCVVNGEEVHEQVVQPDFIKFDQVDLEVREGAVQPDVICSRKTSSATGPQTHRLIVEIYVTHKVGEEKNRRLAERGETVLEIDLSKYRRALTGEDLVREVLHRAPRKWLFHRKEAVEKAKLEAKMAELARKERARLDQVRAARERFLDWYEDIKREPIKGASPEEKKWADSVYRSWRLVGGQNLTWELPDREIFEVEETVVLSVIYRPLEPWCTGYPKFDAPNGLEIICDRLVEEIKAREWVREALRENVSLPQMGGPTTWVNFTRSAVVNAFRKEVGYRGQEMEELGSRLARLRREFVSRWSEIDTKAKDILGLAHSAEKAGVRLRLAGCALRDEREARNAVEASILNSLPFPAYALRHTLYLFFSEGRKGSQWGVLSQSMHHHGLSLEIPGEPELQTNEIVEQLEHRWNDIRSQEVDTIASREAEDCLSVFLSFSEDHPHLAETLFARAAWLRDLDQLTDWLRPELDLQLDDPVAPASDVVAFRKARLLAVTSAMQRCETAFGELGEGRAMSFILQRCAHVALWQLEKGYHPVPAGIKEDSGLGQIQRAMKDVVGKVEKYDAPDFPLAFLTGSHDGGKALWQALLFKDPVRYRQALGCLRAPRAAPQWVQDRLSDLAQRSQQ